jgi:nitronate monooxygenase
MLHTKMTELFDIEYPIVCGGMLHVGVPEFCAAVSNAGGLGSLVAANYNAAEEVRDAIRRTKALTDKPFMVNITLMPSFRITEQMYDEFFAVCAEEGVACIEISGRFADKYIPMLHDAGVKIGHKVGALRHAKKVESLGYDFVISAGVEEGGHPLSDDVTTMILTPRISETVGIPVITAGGIADGRGLAAALCLGADGVMMATRFLATEECLAHQNVKEEIIARQENDTLLICQTTGLQARALKNSLVGQVVEIERDGGGIDRLHELISGDRLKKAIADGSIDDSALLVGQTIGLIHAVVSCRTLMQDMVADAKLLLEDQRKKFS